jgi:uncharacterized protein involved in exopolysaccharide biosynthesis
MDSWQTSFRDLLVIVFKHKWSALTIVTAGMFGVLFWMFFIRQDKFDTTAKILVKIGHEQANSSTLSRPAVMITGDRSQDVNSEVGILLSNDLLDALITHFNLDKPAPPKPPPPKLLPRIRYEVRKTVALVRAWKNQWMIALGLKEPLSPREETLAQLRQAVLVTPERNSNVITVHLFVEQREYGAELLNKLLDLYQVFRLKLYKEHGTPEFFRAEADRTFADLRQAEEQLRAFEAHWNISAIQKQKEVLLEQIASEQSARNSVQIEVRDVAAKLARAEQERGAPEPDVGSIGSFQANTFPEALLQQLAALQAERERLRLTELESSPLIRNNREQFRLALQMVAAHLRSVLADKQSNFERRAQLVAGLQNQVRSLQDKEGQWSALKRNIRMLEESYQGYQKRYDETAATAVMEQRNIGNVAVIEHAVNPVVPSGMSKVRILGLAALLCLFAAAAWMGIAEFLDHRVYTVAAVEQHLEAPVLEVIPAVKGRRWFFRRALPDAGSAYRKAAWALVNRMPAAPARAILFSSSAHGEGTTSAVLAVAEHLSRRDGLRTLVVEVDRRSPAYVKRFSLDPAKTVDSYAAGQITALECVQQNGSGVSFVPTTGVSNGHLGMAHFRKLLEEVRPNFDVVLFDGPPVFDADTITVASLVKKVVLVVESGRTRYEMLERAKAELAGENVEIVGAILNKQKYFIPGWVYRWVIA